jgi:hypothetical protein
MALLIADCESPVLRAAAVKPPASTTAMKAFNSWNRSIPFLLGINIMAIYAIIIGSDITQNSALSTVEGMV